MDIHAIQEMFIRGIGYTTIFLLIGVILSSVWKQKPARANQILFWAVLASLITPVVSELVRRNGWGLFSHSISLPSHFVQTEESAQEIDGRHTKVAESTKANSIQSKTSEDRGSSSITSGFHKRKSITNFETFSLVKIIGIVWGFFTLFLLLKFIVSLIQEMRILRHAKPLNHAKIHEALETVLDKLNLKISPTVYETKSVRSPVICGWGIRPSLLIPVSGIEDYSLQDWEGILCHELAHVKRGDCISSFLTDVLLLLYPWHPLVWWVRYRLDHLCEMACDDWVITKGYSVDRYAQSLLQLLPQRRPAFAMRAVGLRRKLEERIENLYQESPKYSPIEHIWRWSMSMATFFLVIFLSFLQFSSDSIHAVGSEQKKGIVMKQLSKEYLPGVYSSIQKIGGKYACGVDEKKGSIILKNMETGERRMVSDYVSWSLDPYSTETHISPDGKLIAYVCYYPETAGKEKPPEIRIIDVDTGEDRSLFTHQKYESYDIEQWIGQHNQLLVTIQEADQYFIALLSISNQKIDIVKTVNKEKGWPHCRINPALDCIFYQSKPSQNVQNYDIYVYSLVNNTTKALIEHPANDQIKFLSPDGSKLYFISDRFDNLDLFVQKIDNSSSVPQLIKKGIGTINMIGVTNEGKVYFDKSERCSEVYTANFDINKKPCIRNIKPLPVKQKVRFKAGSEWSPMGTKLAYTTYEKNSGPITANILSFSDNKIIHFAKDYPILGWFLWSKDGQYLYSRYGNDQYRGLCKINIATGTIETLTALEHFGYTQIFPCGLSPDNETLYYWAKDGKKRKRYLSYLDVSTGESILLLEDHYWDFKDFGFIGRADLSPDGKWLAYLLYNMESSQVKINVMSTANRESHEIAQFDDVEYNEIRWLEWMPDNNAILVTRSNEEGNSLWKVTKNGEKPARLWGTDMNISWLRVHPKKNKVAFTDYSRDYTTWEMSHLF